MGRWNGGYIRNFPLYPLGYPLRQQFWELGGPAHPVFGVMVGLSLGLDKFVLDFQCSAAFQKYGGPKTIGVEIWVKIWEILPFL